MVLYARLCVPRGDDVIEAAAVPLIMDDLANDGDDNEDEKEG